MDTIHTKSSEVSTPSSIAPLAPSPQSTSAPSFFNTALRPQVSSLSQQRVNLDPATFLLFTALLSEIKTQNDIALAKMKNEADEKQEALETAEKEKIDDENRFERVKYSMYM